MVVNYLKQARQKLGTKSRSDTMIAAMRLIEEQY
jgi:DNA-binding CsgD family transcriptional regulator